MSLQSDKLTWSYSVMKIVCIIHQAMLLSFSQFSGARSAAGDNPLHWERSIATQCACYQAPCNRKKHPFQTSGMRLSYASELKLLYEETWYLAESHPGCKYCKRGRLQNHMRTATKELLHRQYTHTHILFPGVKPLQLTWTWNNKTTINRIMSWIMFLYVIYHTALLRLFLTNWCFMNFNLSEYLFLCRRLCGMCSFISYSNGQCII